MKTSLGGCFGYMPEAHLTVTLVMGYLGMGEALGGNDVAFDRLDKIDIPTDLHLVPTASSGATVYYSPRYPRKYHLPHFDILLSEKPAGHAEQVIDRVRSRLSSRLGDIRSDKQGDRKDVYEAPTGRWRWYMG